MHTALSSHPLVRPPSRLIAMRYLESWLDLLAVQRPLLILNHHGEGHRRAGIGRLDWLNSHGTWPNTGRLEWRPLTGRNRPFDAAADHQHQEHESPHHPVSPPWLFTLRITRSHVPFRHCSNSPTVTVSAFANCFSTASAGLMRSCFSCCVMLASLTSTRVANAH